MATSAATSVVPPDTERLYRTCMARSTSAGSAAKRKLVRAARTSPRHASASRNSASSLGESDSCSSGFH